MSRKAFIKPRQTFADTLSDEFESVSLDEIVEAAAMNNVPYKDVPIMAWRSKHFCAQLFSVDNAEYPLMLRLTVNRTRVGKDGRWQDGITWDELNAIKQDLGYGDWWGVEMYPPTQDIQNINNFRHLWITPTPLSIGFTKKG